MKRYSGMLKKLGLTLKDALSVGYLGNYREMTAAKARKSAISLMLRDKRLLTL